jgi:hypothetical protein
MSKPDTRVAIASLLISALAALGACNHTTAKATPGDASGTNTASGDAPALPVDAVVAEAPAAPAEIAADTANDSQRDTSEPLEAQGETVCTIPIPIAGPDCDRCLTQRCCQQAQQCPFLATLQGAPFGPGCRNGLRCLRRCPDAGTCRLDQAGPAGAVCSNGIGPQGGVAMMAFLNCAAASCPVECAEGL